MENNVPTWLTSIRATSGSTYNAAVGFSFLGGDWARNTGMFSDNPDSGGSATLKFRIATSNSTADPYLEISPSKVSVYPITASTSKTTGALTVAGGLGVNGNIYASNLNTSGTITSGAVTYPNSLGTTDQVLSITSSGTVAWKTPASSGGSTYSLGLNADLGGYVFFVTPDGKHGLVVTTQFQSLSSTWHEAQNVISNPNNHNTDGKKFTDWRLPTKSELAILCTMKNTIGGFGNYLVWSSTGYNDGVDKAWWQTFADCGQAPTSKNDLFCVRGVRSF